jgi:hypothetical protein
LRGITKRFHPVVEQLMLGFLDDYARWIGFGVLACFVAYCMRRRRNRWVVTIASIVGLVTCIPAPLAAIILMRMRRKEVWGSFDRLAEDEVTSN